MRLRTILFSLALAGSTLAQGERAQATPFVMPAGETPLATLIDTCADYLEWNVLYDAKALTDAGLVTRLQRQIVTDRDGCEELLYTLLYRKGYAIKTIDPKRDVFEAIMMSGPRAAEISASAAYQPWQSILDRPTLKRPVITTFALKHIHAQRANNALRPFFAGRRGPSTLMIGSVGDEQSLLLQGFQDQVAQAIQVIQLADKPQKPRPAIIDGMSMSDFVRRLEERVSELEAKLRALRKHDK